MRTEDHLRAILSYLAADPVAVEDVKEYWTDMLEEAEKSLVHPEYKFNEGILINELRDYVDSTYSGHYNKNKFQAMEIIIEADHGVGFASGNITKYNDRYGKKGDREEWRKDIMKILHYALILLYIHDSEEA